MAVKMNATEYLRITDHLISQIIKSEKSKIAEGINNLSGSSDRAELVDLIARVLSLKETCEGLSQQYTSLAKEMDVFSNNVPNLFDTVLSRFNSLPKSQESLSGDTIFFATHMNGTPIIYRKVPVLNEDDPLGYTSDYTRFSPRPSPAASEEEGEPPTVSPDEDSLEDELGSVSSRSTSGSDDSDIPSDVMPRISSESKEMD